MRAAAVSNLSEFRLLYASGLLASLGSQISVLALPLLVLRQTGSAVEAGAIGTVSVGALLLTALPGGALADSVERRRLMRICDVGSLLAASALAVAVLHGESPLVLVLLVAGASAVINSFYGPAALGLLRAVVPKDMLATAASRMQARGAAVRLVGPLLGGALFAWHTAAPFVAEAIGLLLSTTCLAFMRTRSTPEVRSGSILSKEQLGAGLVFLWNQPYLRTVLIIFGLGMNSAFSAMIFAALTISSNNGHSGLGGGLVGSLTALGSLAGALVAPRVQTSGGRSATLIRATCWTCAAAVGVLAISHPPVLIGLMAAVCMAMASVASVGFLTSLLMLTPEVMTGRVQSAANLLSSLAQPLGPLSAGVLLSTWGASPTLGLLACIFAVCAIAVTWAPSIRRQTAMEKIHGQEKVLSAS